MLFQCALYYTGYQRRNPVFYGVNVVRKTVVFLWTIGLLLLLCGCGSRQATQPEASVAVIGSSGQPVLEETVRGTEEPPKTEGDEPMRIQVQAGERVIVFALNGSRAAKALYAQLPLRTAVENFSTNEKVFYPPQKLSISGTPLADAQEGTLAYYAPWGDVVLFYESHGKSNGLYELGRAVSGMDEIEKLTGTIIVTAVD